MTLCVVATEGSDPVTPLVWCWVGLEARWTVADWFPVDDVTKSVGATGAVTRRGAPTIDANTVQRAILVTIGTHALWVAAGGIGVANHARWAGALVAPT